MNRTEIERFLREDIGVEDITSQTLPSGEVVADIISKDEGTLAGLAEAMSIFGYFDISTSPFHVDGDHFKEDEVIMSVKGEARDIESVKELLKKEMVSILGDSQPIVIFGSKPFVILAVGVNGVGKTTTIGKLASRFRMEGLSVLLAAGDTFRAAGIEQLEIWAKRADAHFVKHQSGSDPAAVAYDAVTAARSRNMDAVIVDTAGRLHTKSNLMEELKKVKRSIDKAMPGAPQEILLVVDATTGQNALRQAELFNEAIGITGIALTKLDGTAKGGIVFAIRRGLGIPVRLIGVGEGIDDLRDFDPKEFVEALFS
jgi:fused signal recognition particle receptor